jgi:hypothetical protein
MVRIYFDGSKGEGGWRLALDAEADLKNERMNDELWPALLQNTISQYRPVHGCFMLLSRPFPSHSLSLVIHYDRRFINRSNLPCSPDDLFFRLLVACFPKNNIPIF